ncbi:MAG TPA: DUF309 domain-containing protein [Gemmataceae bacterium]|jgi:hypothetical protein|nr:DUF309 domain-containing protein [Gemmataceae bacterium]
MSATPPAPRPRLVPERDLPPYAHVPGRTPHPGSEPRGHGAPPERIAPIDPDRWQACIPYLYGIDLFNHGYYWEAHEAWEALWHACGRGGPIGNFLKGLIKLAAAGVKVRQGQPSGVRDHAQGARELFEQTARQRGGEEHRYLGLHLGELIRFAREVAEHPPTTGPSTNEGAEVVFAQVLCPV